MAALGSSVAAFALALPTFAQDLASSARFDISGYSVEGSPLLPSEVFAHIMSPFIGRQKSPADVAKAQQALQRAYFDRGYCSVQATVIKSAADATMITLRLMQAAVPAIRDCESKQMQGKPPIIRTVSEAARTGITVLLKAAQVLGLRGPSNSSVEISATRNAPTYERVAAADVAPAAKPDSSKGAAVIAPVAEARSRPTPVVVEALPLRAAPSPQQTGDSASLRFDIKRFLVEGNTLLKPDVIRRAVQAYAGAQKDFSDVQRALETLQTAYQDLGYGAVQVTLPEQELESGEVRLEVIETRLAGIEVQGNEYYDERNIRSSLPGLRVGTTPNSLEIARSLKIANESATKQTQVSLKAGAKDGEIDAVLKVIDERPAKYSASFDNTGTSNTGRFRLGFGYQYANLFNRDHALTLQYSTNPEHPSAVTILGLGYRIPLYGLGDSMDFIAGYSDVTSGTVQQLFNVAGAGTVYGVRYNQHLNRIDNYEHRITYGVDYRAFKNNVTFVSSTQPLVPDITIHPVSITYSGTYRDTATEFGFYGTYHQNIFPGGNDGAGSDFRGPSGPFHPNGARFDAKAGYGIVRFGANLSRLIFGEWQIRASVAAQLTDAALITGEQFGLGGADSVRGFDERQFSSDRGHRASFELYTPDLAGKIGWTGGRGRMLAFYDTGTVSRNIPQPGEQDGLSLDSIGLGLRLQAGKNLSARFDFARVLHDGGITAGRPDGRRGSSTLHGSIVLVY